MSKLANCVFLVVLVCQVHSFNDGPPDSVCSLLIPTGHTSAGQASDPPGGFYIFTDLLEDGNDGAYAASTTYEVTLGSPSGDPYLGFLIQARNANDGSTLIGSFTLLDSSNSQLLNCPNNGAATVVHTNNNRKTSISFQWTSPSTSGRVQFRYTVVTGFANDYYANLNAADHRPSCPFLPTALGDHSIRVGIPTGCSGTDCNYYVGLSPNENDPDYMDVYLDGEAMGWVAIGFSLNRMMEEDDVLGCRRNSDDTVTAVDTWNPSPRQSANVLDNSQTDTCTHFASFSDGRITCSFSRLIEGGDDAQDHNLNNTFYLFYGRRLSAQTVTSLASHTADSIVPVTSPMTFNPVLDSNSTGPIAEPNDTCPPAPGADAEFTFEFGNPDDDFYFAARVNPQNPLYLDMRLAGSASGWIGIGFSDNRLMESDDVLGCIRDSTDNDLVSVVDTYNPSTRYSPNLQDPTQEGVCTHTTNFTEGRITCTFSRLIEPIGDSDRSLNQPWFLLFGTSSTGGDALSSLPRHSSTPSISESRANVALLNLTCPPAPGSDAEFTFEFDNPDEDFYFAARVNPQNPLFLDMRLAGSASGWIGIGFSDNRQMESDDVLGCIRDSTDDDLVSVVDTYNPSTQYSPNDQDPTQEGVCTHTTDFSEGRINCTFSRLIEPIGDSDRNLNQSWFLLFGTSDSGGDALSSLPRHSSTPSISESRANVALDASASTSDFPRIQLLKVHGILMVITWPLLAVTAIFFAAWMKPALPNGEWFQLHRVFMIVALFVGAIGFIFAFVANADNSTPGLISFACGENRAHFALGIIVFALQIANPIISAFRCSPTGKNRWIFNLTHGTLIGFMAELLALANVGIGIALFEAGGCNVLEASEYTILWVYVGFVIFLLILQVVLLIVFTVVAFAAEPEKRAGLAPSMLKLLLMFVAPSEKSEKPIEMTDPSKLPEKAAPSNDPPPRKPPSKDAPLRWIGLAVFLPVTLALMLAVIILVIIQ